MLIKNLELRECNIQKQPSRVVLRKRCFENMLQIYGRTPIQKLLCNFIEIAFPHGCSPVLKSHFGMGVLL